MNRLLLVVSLTAIAIMLAGCGSPDEVGGPSYEPVSYIVIGHGRNAHVEDVTEVRVQTEDQWRGYADLLVPLGELQDVDFETNDVLLIALPVSSGGYDLSVDDVAMSDEELVVRFLLEEPGENCLVAQVMLTPFIAVTVPAGDLPVRFEQRVRRYSCGVRQ